VGGWDLELAHHGGQPLAARGDVTFVYHVGDGDAAAATDPVTGAVRRSGRKDGTDKALRVLAVFSQPTKMSVLALRRERYALTRLIRRIVEAALADILRTAVELPPADSGPGIATHLREWEPVIAAIAATCRAGQDAPAEFLQLLDEQAKIPDWAALAVILRRILAGERGVPLLTGLDPIDTAIVREVLARIGQGM